MFEVALYEFKFCVRISLFIKTLMVYISLGLGAQVKQILMVGGELLMHALSSMVKNIGSMLQLSQHRKFIFSYICHK